MAFRSGKFNLVNAGVSGVINLATSTSKLKVNGSSVLLTLLNSVLGNLVALRQVSHQSIINRSSGFLASSRLDRLNRLGRSRFHCLLGLGLLGVIGIGTFKCLLKAVFSFDKGLVLVASLFVFVGEDALG